MNPEQEPGRPVEQLSRKVVSHVVHVARPTELEAPVISDEVRHLHDRSVRLYPDLNLSANEYIIAAVRRHPIGLVRPLALGTIFMSLVLSIAFNYDAIVETLSISGPLANTGFVTVPALFLAGIAALAMFISYYVYSKNKFYLTNESVVQEIQDTLFSMREQTVSLGNIEDASYTQSGILQQLFDYGDIRLSTEGDETTYRFSYVAHPKDHIARLNNAVEAFKNGRPVTGD